MALSALNEDSHAKGKSRLLSLLLGTAARVQQSAAQELSSRLQLRFKAWMHFRALADDHGRLSATSLETSDSYSCSSAYLEIEPESLLGDVPHSIASACDVTTAIPVNALRVQNMLSLCQ